MMMRFLAPALMFVAVPAFAQDEDRRACIEERIARYADLCEPADVVAEGIAHACAPAPPPRVTDDREAELRRILQRAVHQSTYADALTAVLDARARQKPNCV